MSETQVSDLVALVEAERVAGRTPDIAALCGDDPELHAAVVERLRLLGEFEQVTRSAPAAPSRGPVLPAGYELLGELGRGGMGVVYKARDPRGGVVAVKTLTHLDPARLAYLKREFAALAGLRHENLVTVYAQIAEGANWYCVMELVEGVHFLEYVRGGGGIDADNARLRSVFAQLAAALHTLHRAGKLHRDVKSSNALVTADGRVKLLDFGLVADLGGDRDRPSGPVGTVDYMSPEQFGTGALSPASDWYSFGTLLFAALCGRLPFAGHALAVMRAKEASAPPRPSTYADGIPLDLEALCVELLAVDPAARPSGLEVLRRLGGSVAHTRAAVEDRTPLVGRESHFAALRAAAADTRRHRRPVVVEVHGPSGVGKSELVGRFMREAGDGGRAVVLAGRCYEQSAVPYKVFDGVVDALLRHLRRQTREQAAAVLPVHLADLARLFPVLGRLEAVAESPPPTNPDDPHEARRRGFAALRELFTRLAARTPVWLFADDVQWGDRESIALLEELVRLPDAPPLLFVFGYRRRDAEGSPFVVALQGVMVERRDLPVDPLNDDEGRALATTLLGAATDPAGRFAAVIARESGGNPLFIHELVEHQFSQPGSTDPPTLDAVLRGRVARLADDPRRLLEVVAVAVGPLDVESAFRAARVPPERQSASLHVLVAGRAVRTGGGEDGGRTVEPFHDRVREVVAGDLPAEVKVRHHRELAVVLTASGAELEVLAHHFEHAREADRAIDYYAQAAEQSGKALAFDRSADQYCRALALCGPTDPRRKGLLLGHAASLAKAARAVEAANQFAAAAELGTGMETLFCRQRAAEQMIRAGRLDEGMRSLTEVLAAVEIVIPPTSRALRRSIVWLRLRLWARGLKVHPRANVAAEDRLRIEACAWAATLIRLSDPLLAAWFHTLGLLLSLQAGDAYGVAFGIAREMVLTPWLGSPSEARVKWLYERGRQLAARLPRAADQTYTEAFLDFHRFMGYALLGDSERALSQLQPTDDALRRCAAPSVAYQRSMLRAFEAYLLQLRGDLRASRDVLEMIARGQLDRGNVYLAVNIPLLGRAHLIDLADDRPTDARAGLHAAHATLNGEGYYLQHLYGWVNETEVLLYEGRGVAAWEWCLARWPHLAVQALLTDHSTRSFAFWTRGRSAVGYAAEAPADRAWVIADAVGVARRLGRMPVPYFAPGLGRSLRAAVLHLRGDMAGAIRELKLAEETFARWGVALHAAAVRYRRGQLTGGEPGAKQVAEAEEDLRSRGVKNPSRFVNVFVPGFRV